MKKGTAASFEDFLAQVSTWATDTTIHGSDAWTLLRSDPWPRGTIFRAAGRQTGEYQYIGLLPSRIEKGKTYAEWFLEKKNLATHFVWSSRGMQLPGRDFDIIRDRGILIRPHNATGAGLIDTPDIFEASAQVLHMGVFKQYAADLDWDEQAGGMDLAGQSLLQLQYRPESGNGNLDYRPPLYPGCGYPALSMDFSGPETGYFDYWLVKDAQRMVIVMHNDGIWDTAFLGQFEPYGKQEYAFPAMVAGGTSGLVSVGRNYWYSPGQVTPTPVIGLRLDYRPRQWSLTHGIIPFAAAGEDAANALTQAMVCLPDGRWQGAANYVQQVQAVADHACNHPVTNYHFVRQEPARPANIMLRIRPTESDIIDFSHGVGRLKLEPVELLQTAGDRRGILGKLPYIVFPSRPICEYGEITIDGKRYLSVPNGWENRKFHIKGHASIVYDCDPDELLAEERRIEKLSQMMHLLIKLED